MQGFFVTKSRFQGISLDSFLQMVQMDKTSCTLKIESKSGDGVLYIINGDLVDAECFDLSGPEAALEIVSWRDVSFEFENICDDRIRRINMPLMHLLMEGLKRRDDRAAGLIPDTTRPKAAKQPSSESLYRQEDVIPDLDLPKEPSVLPPIQTNETTVSSYASVEPKAEETIALKTVSGKAGGGKPKFSLPLMIGSGVLAIILVAFCVMYLFFGSSSDERAFRKTVDLIGKTADFSEKEKIIRKFMDDHKDSDYFDKARASLDEIKKDKAKKEYEDADQEIKKLTIDSSFVDRAGKILNAYLQENPDSVYKENVSERLIKLPEIYEDSVFASASKDGATDPEKRSELLSDFITKFPAGKNYDNAKSLLVKAEEDYYRLLVSSSSECIEKDDFSPCVRRIESYRKIFGNDSRKYPIENLLANMAGGRDLAAMKQKADSMGDDLDAKRDLYYEYLRTNTQNTEARQQVRRILDEIERSITERKDWESTKNYATNSSYPLKERARRLESFIARKPDSIYLQEASRILDSLGAGKRTVESAPRITQDTRSAIESSKNENVSISGAPKTSADFARAWALIGQAAGTRFRNNGNGTFSDSTTGKMWCVLDSKADIGRCLSYRDALVYVNSLNTGGYGDWRLPTAPELYSVYKNAPAIPDTGSNWYWSSDAVWRGLNEIVRIVRPGVESEIRSETISVSDCGFVRAVRN